MTTSGAPIVEVRSPRRTCLGPFGQFPQSWRCPEFLSISVCFLSLPKNMPMSLKNKPNVISVISVGGFGVRH